MSTFFLRNASTAFLVCSSLFLAIHVKNLAYPYIYFIGSIFILSSLILYKLFISYKNKIAIPNNNYLIFVLSFLIWASLSSLWSPATITSVKSIFIFCLLPFAILIGFWSSLKQQQYFYSCLIFLLLAISWKAGHQSFLSDPKLPAPGFFANKNTNASFISMILLPICAQFLSTKTKTKIQAIYGVLLFIGTFIISLTVSRGAVLGLTIGLTLLLIHTLYHKLAFTPFIRLASYLGAGYLSSDLLNGAANWTRLTHKTLTTNINAISSGRDDLWLSGWHMYLDQPIFGWGLNTFHLVFPQYRQSPDLGQYVHNDYFQFLIELGPIGFVLFIGFVVTLILSSKKLYLLTTDKNEKLYILGLVGACLSVLTHSCFTFNLYQPAPLLLLGLYIGVLTQKLNLASNQNNLVFQANKRVTPLGYFSVLSLLGLILIYLASIDIISRKKVYSHHKNNLIALEEAERAYQLTSYETNILTTQVSLYIDLLYNEKNDINNEGKDFLIDKGIKTSKIAIEKNPYVHLLYIHTAKLYLLSSEEKYPDKKNNIRTAFRQAMIVNPFNLNSRLEYIKVLMQLNEKQEAIEVFKGALGKRYFGKYKDPIYYLQLFLALISDSGNETAISSLKHQIDELHSIKEKKGFYTLKNWDTE